MYECKIGLDGFIEANTPKQEGGGEMSAEVFDLAVARARKMGMMGPNG